MMLKKLLILLFCTFFVLPYSIVMANEESKYEVVDKNEIYEIRKYSDRLACLLYTSPSPRDLSTSRMPSSA